MGTSTEYGGRKGIKKRKPEEGRSNSRFGGLSRTVLFFEKGMQEHYVSEGPPTKGGQKGRPEI